MIQISSLRKSKRLQKGATIGIAAPSSGLAGLFPHRIEKGLAAVAELGFTPLLSAHALGIKGYISSSAQERASDLNDLFRDPKVSSIICTIGGNHANQILNYLDFDLIKNNPKIFIGYSDITVLHYALRKKSNLMTFYGPCIVSEFGEYPSILPFTKEYFLKSVMMHEPIGMVPASESWTDEFLDWSAKKDLVRPRKLERSFGYEWWRQGSARAPIFGGAIPSINHLAGTEYWIDPKEMIFFIDIPEGGPGTPFPLSDLDAFLTDLDNLGVFKSIVGLIIGRPYRYSSIEIAALRELVDYYTAKYSYPILYNANIGHASPIITLPLGAIVKLDSASNLFSIEESGVL